MNASASVQFATFPQRLLAFNIDMTLFLLTVMPLTLVVENDNHFAMIVFGTVILYHSVMESSAWGATLGKKYAGLRVVTDSGSQLSFLKAVLRIMTKHLSLLIFFIGFFMIYVRKDRKGLHDVLTGTTVRVEPKKVGKSGKKRN